MLGYCYSQALEQASNRLPSNVGRSSMIHRLIAAYGLLQHNNVVVINSVAADRAELASYHDVDYVDTILDCEQSVDSDDEIRVRYGLEHDCPIFAGLSNYAKEIAGASLTAARSISRPDTSIETAINWDGGRHHARRGSASGFCYVADAVLAIQSLRKHFDRVIYIDLDVHHGDGVESAFIFSDKVFTLSVHRYDAGFFPRTGSWQEQGKGKGKGYTLNLPLKAGLSDDALYSLTTDVILPLLQQYFNAGHKTAVVVQCGVDSLALDPLREWNLSISGYCRTIAAIQSCLQKLNFKALYLGGGGYDKALASRCYAAITATLLNHDLESTIPEHSLWHEYGGTGHDLSIFNSIRGLKDENTETIQKLVSCCTERLRCLQL